MMSTIKQCVTECEPDSKVQKRTLTTITFLKFLKSAFLTVLLKAGKQTSKTE